MKFGLPQKVKFSATYGTYSEVTPRENYDSQITAVDDEAALLIYYFGEHNIFRGRVRDSNGQAAQNFLLHPTGQRITLNLVFPKPEKQELRLYISNTAGFMPLGGHIWFLFLRDNSLWIGSMSESEWRSENRILTTDDSDSFYQHAIAENDVRVITRPARDIYARNPAIALHAFRNSGYQCEFDPTHFTFDARSTNFPYMEAHHLIPMGSQEYYTRSLDNIHNVFCLCATCHRAIHYSVRDTTREIIDKLILSRPAILDEFNLTPLDIYRIYSIEDIQ